MTVIKTPKIWPEAALVEDLPRSLAEAARGTSDIKDVIIKNTRLYGAFFGSALKFHV